MQDEASLNGNGIMNARTPDIGSTGTTTRVGALPQPARPATAAGPHLARDIGPHGRVVVSWTMAGGILLGGFLVAVMTLSGQLSAFGLFMTASALFVLGALLGFVHSLALGLLGRPEGMTLRQARRDLTLATLYAVPGLVLAWLTTIWVAMTVVALYLGRIGPLLGAATGWLIGAALLSTAGVYGWRALRRAYARWPEREVGTIVVAATFGALLVTFLADRPELFGMRLRLTEVGGVLLAAAIAIWVVGPLVTLALRLLPELPTRATVGLHAGRRGVVDAALGLTTGVVFGLLAVPFVVPSAIPATGGAFVIGISQALVDEVLLRLVLVTAVAWLLLRWHGVHREEAAIGAVAAVAVVQALLYTPGVMAIGFPTAIGAVAFTVTAVVLPALAFGFLFWTRGFSTAVLADAAFVAVILLLAA